MEEGVFKRAGNLDKRFVDENGGSMKRNLAGRFDHKFLTRQVTVVSHTPGL